MYVHSKVMIQRGVMMDSREITHPLTEYGNVHVTLLNFTIASQSQRAVITEQHRNFGRP